MQTLFQPKQLKGTDGTLVRLAKNVKAAKTCEILANLVIATTSAELIRVAVNGCSGASR